MLSLILNPPLDFSAWLAVRALKLSVRLGDENQNKKN